MLYKILYLEDLDADSFISDFKNRNIEVDQDKASDEKATIKTLSKGGYDAYIMDFRLSSGKERLDAPSYAAYLRTELENTKVIQIPIILLTNEKQLQIVRERRDKQKLFDMVITKDEYDGNPEYWINLIRVYIETFKQFYSDGFNLEKVLGLSEYDIRNIIDSQLLRELNMISKEKDASELMRYIMKFFLMTPGILIDESYLAARFGVDSSNSGESWQILMDKLEGYSYKGVMSGYYKRWWMHYLSKFMKEISPDCSFRIMNAEERVALLNEKLGLKLKMCKPIEHNFSTSYWTVCRSSGLPLDPSEGYICNSRYKRDWEENEYVSLVGALKKTEFLAYVSSRDKKEILTNGYKI